MKGISSRIERKGTALIIQTQDVAGVSSYIETLVYGSGRLLLSRKAQIPAGSAAAGPGRLDKLMADAHQAVLDDIAAGRIDDRLPGPGR